MQVERCQGQSANYSATRKELLAVVSFVKYFKHYLLGRHFFVRTDHTALQWLWKIPDPVGHRARWIGFLEEFDFAVVHRPGRQHLNAEAMSRFPYRPDEDSCRSGLRGSQPVKSEVGGRSPWNVRTAKHHAVDLDLQTEVGQKGTLDVPVESPVDVIPGVQNGSC